MVAGDFIMMQPVSPRLREPLRAALRGVSEGWPDDLSADELAALKEHGIVPLVYAATRAPQLRAQAVAAASVEVLRLEDLREVLVSLDAAGVAPLLVKGSALAYDVYASPELRPRGDTDILIREDDRERVREVMTELGCVEQMTSGDEHGVRQMTFIRSGRVAGPYAYDVHWSVANPAVFASLLLYDDVAPRALALPHIAAHARGLSPSDALLLACIHRVAHHHDSDRLIWLVDIALLRDRMSRGEHEEFWRRAADARVIGVCERSIELAEEWMSRPAHHRAVDFLPAEVVAQHEPSRAFLVRDISYGGVMAANLRALPPRDRVQRVVQLAFPPRAYMRQQFGDGFLPWLYARRAMRGVVRLFRRVGT